MRALYVSVAQGAAARGLENLAQILGQAERNNRRDRLTGALLRHDGRFLQAFEGLRGDVDRLIGKLQRDPRHHGMRLMAYGPVSARLFPDLPMAQVDLDAETAGRLDGPALEGLKPDEALNILVAAAGRITLAA